MGTYGTKISNNIVGLNLGHKSVKIAYIAKSKSERVLKKSIIKEVDFSLHTNPLKAKAIALRKALGELNVSPLKIICVFNHPLINIRRVKVPRMPRSELLEAMRLDAKHNAAYPIESAAVDVKILNRVKDDGVKKFDVLVTIVPQNCIDDILSVMAPVDDTDVLRKNTDITHLLKSRIQLAAIIPDSIAHQNIIQHYSSYIHPILSSLQLGAESTRFNVFNNGELEFSRQINVSGEDITTSLMVALVGEEGQIKLTREEAAHIKHEYGIPNLNKDKMINGKISSKQLYSMMRPKIEQLLVEIQRSFEFYREAYGGNISQLILFGGGARLRRIDQTINKYIDVDVHKANLKKLVQVIEKEDLDNLLHTNRLDLAIGAALMPPKGVNLLPSRRKKGRAALRVKRLFRLLYAVLVLCILLAAGDVYIKKRALGQTYGLLQKELSISNDKVQKINEWIAFDAMITNQVRWDDILKEISNYVSENIYLTSVNAKVERIVVKGYVVGDVDSQQIVLGEFMLKLEEGIVKNVNLVETRKSTRIEGASEFEIIFQPE